MLDTNELRRRYRRECLRCGGKGTERYCDAAGDMDERDCRICAGAGTVSMMPPDMVMLCEEVERLQTLLNEGDREGEGVCKRCNGTKQVLICSDTDAFVCGWTPCPECEKGAYP